MVLGTASAGPRVEVVEMAKALIGPTGYGSFGIVWRDFPSMERRGGYSGPYRTLEEAERGARDWADAYDEPLGIEHVENVNELPGATR